MAPPEGSIFDPARKWEEEKESRRQARFELDEQEKAAVFADKQSKKGGGKKTTDKKKTTTTAEKIKLSNALDKDLKDHLRDLQKLSNLKTLKALQDVTCETTGGKINRMIKMLHLAVCDLKQGTVNASEAEVLDILWALEEMPSFKAADELVSAEKAAKKEDKSSEKDKKDSKKASLKKKLTGFFKPKADDASSK